MLVIARVASAIARGTQRHAGRVQRVRDPIGEQRVDAGPVERGSRRDATPRAAGSRSRAAATSQRISRHDAGEGAEPPR